MNSIDFVKYIIDEMVDKFPLIKCSYEYKIESNTHFIMVLPSSVYKMDEEYARAETKATLAFNEMYLEEGICFITDDAIVKLDSPIYVKKGLYFAAVPNVVSPQNIIRQSELMSLKTSLNIEVTQNLSLFDAIKGFVNIQVQSSGKNIFSNTSTHSMNPSSAIPNDSFILEEEPKYLLVA